MENDQMHLLTICLMFHSHYVDESIQQVLREKNYHQNMYKMQCGDLETFRDFFTFACPKYVPPCAPGADVPVEDYAKEPLEHQSQLFMFEVRQQYQLSTIHSYLKLRITLPIE